MSALVLAFVLRGALVLSLAIVAVLLLRRPVRRLFGAVASYGLWLVVPLCLIAGFLPGGERAAAPVVDLVGEAGWSAETLATAAPRLSDALVAVWIAGVAATVAVLIVRQARFVRSLGRLTPWPVDPRLLQATHSQAGPLVLGALRPRIVLPADFDARFVGEARGLVIAHERVHLARGDALINALTAAIQCLGWFNPLVHLAARRLRIDQEIACDAVVLASRPGAVRLYATALVDAVATPLAAPLGCHWPAAGLHPLKERLMVMGRTPASSLRRRLGLSVVGALALAGAGAIWTLNPGPAAARAEWIEQPRWLLKPDGEDVARDYPADAFRDGASGTAVVDCRVAADGRLRDCTVSEESPSPYRFGEAALKLTRHFQMAELSRDGRPTRGGAVRIPIMFAVPKPRV